MKTDQCNLRFAGVGGIGGVGGIDGVGSIGGLSAQAALSALADPRHGLTFPSPCPIMMCKAVGMPSFSASHFSFSGLFHRGWSLPDEVIFHEAIIEALT